MVDFLFVFSLAAEVEFKAAKANRIQAMTP
jgi:hypothetical protein